MRRLFETSCPSPWIERRKAAATHSTKKNGGRAEPCNATHTLPLASNQNQLSGFCMGRDMQKHSEKKNQAYDADNRVVAIRSESS